MCFTFIKVKIIQLIILCTSAFIHSYVQTCVPCEEHTQCKVNFTYLIKENKETFLIWKLDAFGMAICYTSGDIACYPYPGVDPNVKFSIKSEGGHITTEVSILNTTRAGNPLPLEKRWELFAHNQDSSSRLIYTCDFKLYNKVSKTICKHEATEKGLRAKCIVSPVYPNITCKFEFYDQQYKNSLSQIYYHTTLSQDSLVYTTECYVNIPEDVLTPGVLDYNISLWPDVKMDDVIVKAGLIIKANVTLEQPKLSLANCPDTIEVGTYYHCVCAREDNSEIKTWIFWNTKSTLINNFDRIALLRALNTNTDPVEYTCTARNELGWTTFVKYRPVIKNNEINIKLQDCPVEKPYKCITVCYGDYEFCLKGVVYSCQSASSDTLLELCQILATRNSEETKSDHCNDVCKSRLKNLLQEEGNYSLPLLAKILPSCVIATLVLISLILLYCHRKKKKNICFETNSKRDFQTGFANFDKHVNKVTLNPRSVLREELGECIESGKHKYLILCTDYVKNHTLYLKQFSVEHDILIIHKFIVCGITLTVRLDVGFVSEERPQQSNYLTEHRGEHFTHTGTGRIVKVLQSSEACSCPRHIGQMGIPTWNVSIATTTKIVYDDSEAKFTTAELVINDNGKEVCKKLKGCKFHRTENFGDCFVYFSTCDTDLSNKLISTIKEQQELFHSLRNTNDTFFVISHPHGKSKHISFSRPSQNVGFGAVTCPGCYGASFLPLHDVARAGFPVHLGTFQDNGYGTACNETKRLLKS